MENKFQAITRAKLILTESCQLRCKYCYETLGKKTMSLETAKKVIDMVVDNAKEARRLPAISFFGGEPLLVYEELMKPCIEYVRRELNEVCGLSFVTNGLLLDEEKLKYFREMNVDFMLSIDGCPQAHDVNRVYPDGSGSSKDLEEKLPLILRYFPNTRARMTVTPENVQYLYESVRYISDKGFIDMHIIPDLFVLPEGRTWTPADFEELQSQMIRVEDYIIESFEDYDVPLVFLTLADMFPRIVLASHYSKTGKYRTAQCCDPNARCGIGMRDNVAVTPEGEIYACQHGELNRESVLFLGTLSDGISEEARENLLYMNQEPLRSDSLDCEGCPLNTICTGGCVPNNYAINGSFTVVPQSYCRWTQQLYASALRIVTHFDAKQDNELFRDYFYGVVKRGVSCVY